MRCQKCESESIFSQTEILRVPDILIIHLKRFYYSSGGMHKIKNRVKFPLTNLDIGELMISTEKKDGLTVETTRENQVYDLYGVVNHSGNA